MLILPSGYWNCCTSEFQAQLWNTDCFFVSYFVVINICLPCQMGAGGFSVSLPCWSRSGRLLVSRQPDQGRRPGLQQRGQLHVTASPLITRWLTARSPSQVCHCTSTRHNAHGQLRMGEGGWGWGCDGHHCLNMSLKQIQREVQFAHGGGGILGKCASDKSEVFSGKMSHLRCFSLLLVLIAIGDVVFCTVFSPVLLHFFFFKGKWPSFLFNIETERWVCARYEQGLYSGPVWKHFKGLLFKTVSGLLFSPAVAIHTDVIILDSTACAQSNTNVCISQYKLWCQHVKCISMPS